MQQFEAKGWKNVDENSSQHPSCDGPVLKTQWQRVVDENWDEEKPLPEFNDKYCCAQNCTHKSCGNGGEQWVKCSAPELGGGGVQGCTNKATDATPLYNKKYGGWWIAPMCHQCNTAKAVISFELKKGTILVRAGQGATGSNDIAIIV